MKSILLIEDDTELCSLMQDYFAGQGFRIESVHDGRGGLARSLDGGFDLIILDVMLPVLDGFEVLRQLRKRSETPVIMLTARTSQPDRIAGLNAGADDYLPKPFGPEELLARIRAVLRRAGKPDAAPSQELESGGVKLNPLTREAWYQGETWNHFHRVRHSGNFGAFHRPHGVARRTGCGALSTPLHAL